MHIYQQYLAINNTPALLLKPISQNQRAIPLISAKAAYFEGSMHWGQNYRHVSSNLDIVHGESSVELPVS